MTRERNDQQNMFTYCHKTLCTVDEYLVVAPTSRTGKTVHYLPRYILPKRNEDSRAGRLDLHFSLSDLGNFPSQAIPYSRM